MVLCVVFFFWSDWYKMVFFLGEVNMLFRAPGRPILYTTCLQSEPGLLRHGKLNTALQRENSDSGLCLGIFYQAILSPVRSFRFYNFGGVLKATATHTLDRQLQSANRPNAHISASNGLSIRY